jgi:predicted DNA-binding transcriptional regulator AlpA
MKHSDSNSPVQIAEFSLHPAVDGKSVEAIGLVPPIRLIPVERVGEILGFKTSAVLELAARGELPQKIKFGTSRRASARWVEHEIYAYAWALAANRDPVQVAATPSESHREDDGSPSVVAAAKKPASGRAMPKSVGRAK